MICTIFANGALSASQSINRRKLRQNLLVATDGGVRHCLALGLVPDLLIGDMDSIDGQLLYDLKQKGVETRTFPERKDKTDLELAIDLAIEKGATEILILAALGQRWDMSIASVMLLASPRFSEIKIVVRHGPTDLFCLHGERLLELAGNPGDRLSLIPLGGPAIGVTLHGLEYPLEDHPIPLGSTLGLSNVITEPIIRIKVRQGLLLCILERTDRDY